MEKVRIGLVSLGCPKNLVDSEELLGALTEGGRGQLVEADAAADVVVVNTCAFIESAKRESLAAIRAALARKERGEISKVVVAGCLAQRYAETLARDLPDVDGLFGIQSATQIADVVFARRGAMVLPVLGNNFVQPISKNYPLSVIN